MLCERVLRVLAQRSAPVPIWSCKKNETLVSVRFGPSQRALSTSAAATSPFASSSSRQHHHAFLGSTPLSCSQFALPETQLPVVQSPLRQPHQQPRHTPLSFFRAMCSRPPTSSSSSPSAPPSSTANSSATAAATSVSGVTVDVSQGLPQLTVPLPSRNEPCIFTLKPVTHTIGDFLSMLKTEDAGIDRAVIRTTDGVRMSSTTSIQTLMQKDFDLIVNDVPYRVRPPRQDPLGMAGEGSPLGGDDLQRLGDVRALVGQLYEALHVEEHQAAQEQKLVQEMEELKAELEPLERQRQQFAAQAERRTNQMTWLGLGMMSVQFGILARLTWWEYSWDIMEPVTYFVTYGTAMACYAYFVLTKQDYLLPDVRDRQYLLSFHRKAKKDFWDVSKYNSLKEGIVTIERDLKRLRDPLHLRLPPSLVAKGQAAAEKGGLLGAQINMGNLKEMIKSKLS